MPALHEPRPGQNRDRRQRDLPQVLVDRWARLALQLSAKRTGRPAARSATWGRRLLLTAVAVAVVTVAMLVGAARAQAGDQTPARLDHHMT
jgi:hypothetical protein